MQMMTWKPRCLQKVKEEPVSPKPFNWDYDGYYEIEGYEDRNLNRENWLFDSCSPKSIYTSWLDLTHIPLI